MQNFLHAWLVAHPSVRLLTRIDALELERLEVRLARDGGEWRVIGASRR